MNAIAAELLSLKWLDAKVYPFLYTKRKLIVLCETMDKDFRGISAWKIILAMIGFFVAINSSIIGYIVVKQNAMELRQASLIAGSMTTLEGKELLAAINAIKTDVASIPKENPPKWVLEMIQRTDIKVDKLENKIEKLTQK